MIPRLGYSLRFFLVYFLIIGGLAWFIVSKALDTLGSSVSQSAEEVLVDTANLLAELVGQQARDGDISVGPLRQLIPAYLDRKLDARIYDVTKHTPDLQVYVTNAKGIVLFDSSGQSEGADFSRWRDVMLTLQGRYGARSSPLDPDVQVAPSDEKALYVAAPVRQGDAIIIPEHGGEATTVKRGDVLSIHGQTGDVGPTARTSHKGTRTGHAGADQPPGIDGAGGAASGLEHVAQRLEAVEAVARSLARQQAADGKRHPHVVHGKDRRGGHGGPRPRSGGRIPLSWHLHRPRSRP